MRLYVDMWLVWGSGAVVPGVGGSVGLCTCAPWARGVLAEPKPPIPSRVSLFATPVSLFPSHAWCVLRLAGDCAGAVPCAEGGAGQQAGPDARGELRGRRSSLPGIDGQADAAVPAQSPGRGRDVDGVQEHADEERRRPGRGMGEPQAGGQGGQCLAVHPGGADCRVHQGVPEICEGDEGGAPEGGARGHACAEDDRRRHVRRLAHRCRYQASGEHADQDGAHRDNCPPVEPAADKGSDRCQAGADQAGVRRQGAGGRR
mmetsp:Transcript_6542/g.18082  ORF Transcript_6542/g.18082 Transcript_6542/m.18082 type:complete len:259 (+) Transcript_6542:337-1113(+)